MTELTPQTAHRYARLAFGRMLAVAERMGDDLVNIRPHGIGTNPVGALIVHCCGVCEFWLGHVALGRDSDRDREAEFTTTVSVAELRTLVESTVRQVELDLVDVDCSPPSPHAAGRELLADGDRSDGALVLHVLEELFQHLGHAELAADAILGSGR
jgi:DinB superfamily